MIKYPVVELGGQHIKKDFLCNKHASLQEYIRQFASQDVKRGLCKCYVMTEEESNIVQGYYTLSAFSFPKDQAPIDFTKKHRIKYKDIPLVLLGRLAVNDSLVGKKLGRHLLMDALYRSYQASKLIGAIGITANFIDENAKDFYLKFGFTHLPDTQYVILPFVDVKVAISL